MSRRTGCGNRFRSLRDDPTQVTGRAGCSPSIYHSIRILLYLVNAPVVRGLLLGRLPKRGNDVPYGLTAFKAVEALLELLLADLCPMRILAVSTRSKSRSTERAGLIRSSAFWYPQSLLAETDTVGGSMTALLVARFAALRCTIRSRLELEAEIL